MIQIKDAIVFGRLRKWPLLFWKHKAPELKYTFRALKILITSSATLPLRVYEQMRFQKHIKRTEITTHPIFILGFWRSGTTYLQNLLCQDTNFGYVSLLHVLAPEFFLSSEKVLTHLLPKFIPKTRPMDNVELSIDAPQEEELALFNMTNSSLYHQLFFQKMLVIIFINGDY